MGEAKEATKMGKQKWRMGDLLDFLRSTHVGRAAPPVEESWDSEGEEEEAEAVEVETEGAEEHAE